MLFHQLTSVLAVCILQGPPRLMPLQQLPSVHAVCIVKVSLLLKALYDVDVCPCYLHSPQWGFKQQD